MENNMTLSLGGEERTLVFRKLVFMRHLGKLLEGSGFNILDPEIFGNPYKAYQSALYFIHAGLLAGNYKDLSVEKVQEWVDELDVLLLKDIQYAGFSAITGKTVEELKNLIAQPAKENGQLKVTA